MKPNILFILSDQHNAKVLGHKGHPDVKTPHLDRMAEEGVRFDNAITQNPICTPSRVSYISGQYCHNHGYYGLSGHNPNGLPTIFGHFRHFGYTTAAFGKIHCPEYWVEDDCDEFHETCRASVGGRSSEYAQFLRECGKEDLEDHGALTEFGSKGRQSMDGRPSALTYEESQEGWIAAKTIEFMQKAQDENTPFIIHASLPRPHECTTPSIEFWNLYEDKELTLPPNADYDLEAAGKAPNLISTAKNWRTGNWAVFEPKTFEAARMRKLRGYLGAVSQVDHAVGQMLDYIRDAEIAENTIVIYSSDHGDYACEHGIMEKAPGICHDAITRIPMLWWAPGRIKKNFEVKELVETVDISSTICSMAGVDLMETSDGKDLSGLLNGSGTPVRDVAVTEFAWSRSVRKDNFRFVWYAKDYFPEEYPDGFGELYDLEKDPWEMKNLYFDPEYKDKINDMNAELLNWLITTTRPSTVHEASKESSSNWQQKLKYKHAFNADNKINPELIRPLRTNYK